MPMVVRAPLAETEIVFIAVVVVRESSPGVMYALCSLSVALGLSYKPINAYLIESRFQNLRYVPYHVF